MNRLYENDLIYGRLLTIDQPHLIERYNKALKAFGLKPTKLKEFDIDKTGFSPQVAEELNDYFYLDPNAVNRRFIILTPDQASLPVVHTAFSNTDELMYEFFDGNARAINATTIKDVIFGEIEDSVSEVDDIEDLLSINQVEFKVLSAEDTLGKAAELRTLTDRLTSQPDAWRDNELLNRMVELAKSAGDIRENALVPDKVMFRHNAYWTSHFSGLYVFIDEKMITVISTPDAPGFRRSRPWQVSYLSINDADSVYKFLASTGRIDLPRSSWLEPSGFLEHRGEMVIRDVVRRAEPKTDLNKIDDIWLQTWMHRNAEMIRRDGRYPFLNSAKRMAIEHGRIDPGQAEAEFRFLLLRAKPDHPDCWLVNRLITEFAPSDFVARYAFNKQGFYTDYQSWPEPYRAHVVETLKTTYLNDRQGWRKRLYDLP
jgi:hypothetical protein